MNGNGLYTPPPGRPVSTPPSVAPAPKLRLFRYLDKEQSFDVAARYERGEAVREIAAVYGISISVVAYHARRHGVPLRHTEESRANMQAAQLARFHGKKPTSLVPRPVQKDGEDKRDYGRRVLQWMLANDPIEAARIRKALSAGARKGNRKRARLAEARKRAAMAEMVDACAKTMPPLVLTETAPPPPKRKWWQFWKRGDGR